MTTNRYKGGFPVDRLDGKSGIFTAEDIETIKRKANSTLPAPNSNDTTLDNWPTNTYKDPYHSQVIWHMTDAIEANPAGAMHDHSGNGHDAHYVKRQNDWPFGSPYHMGPNHFHSTYFHDQCYRVTDAASLRLGTTAFTIEFWINLHKNTGTEYYVMGKGGQAARGSGTGWVVYISSTYNIGFYDAVGNASTQSSSALNRDQWYHVAIVRSSTAANGTKIYIDGTLAATGTSSGNFTDTNTLYIGRDRVDTAASCLSGKLTDIRISTGALYTANFAKPTTPLTMESPALLTIGAIEPWHPNSPLWQREGLSISLNSSQVTRLADTPFMNKTTNPYYGRGFHSVAMLDGTWFRIKDYTAGGTNLLNFGTGPFTVEAWVRMGDARGSQPICGKGTGNAGAVGSTGWSAYIDSNFRPVWSDAATQVTASNTDPKLYHGGWYHVAYVRTSTATDGFKMYVNGRLSHTATVATNYNDTNDLNLFATRNAELQGSASPLCIVKISKTARYTDAFNISPQNGGIATFIDTVCTSDANTSFLSFGAGTLTREIPMDGGWINEGYGQYSFRPRHGHQYFGEKYPISRTGTSTPANYGGHSAYFYNNSQQVIKARTTSSDFSFGTGDFSIEVFLNGNWRSSEGSSYVQVLFDTRHSYNDSGIVCRTNDGLQGFEVMTNNTMICTTNRGAFYNTKKWLHVVVQRVNGNVALYINGKKESESRYTGNINSPQNRIAIGNGSYPNNQYQTGFWGHMSNFRIVKGVGAYGSYSNGVGGNPNTFTVPNKPMEITANTVFYSLCNSILKDETGRCDVVTGGWTNLNENITTAWDVYSGSCVSPFEAETDFAEFYDSQYMGADQVNSSSGCTAYLAEGSNTTSIAPTLGWIPRMSRAWTIEAYFYAHIVNPAAPTSRGILYTATVASHSGFELNYHYNSAATPAASYTDISFRMWQGANNTYQQLATSGNTGNIVPHSYNHIAIQYDPTKTNKMALFMNGKRVAQSTTAFNQSSRADVTYQLQHSDVGGPFRISDVARYDNDSGTITDYRKKWNYDSNTYILSYPTAPILDETLRSFHLHYGVLPDPYHKKFGKASLKFANDANNTVHVCRLDSGDPTWGSRHKDIRREDATIEMWASWHDLANGGSSFQAAADGACLLHWSNAFWVGISPTGFWQILIKNANGTTYLTLTTTIPVALRSSGNMDFIALVRSGKNWIFYINGVQQQILPHNQGTYTANGPTANHDWDIYGWNTLMLGCDNSALQATKWCGNIQDFRFTQGIARYATRVINNVSTMCHHGTDIPALPTRLFPTK